jgi:hypothetical protein
VAKEAEMAQSADDLTIPIPIPADAAIRLHALPSEAIPFGTVQWVVVVARSQRQAGPPALPRREPPMLMLPHGAGERWIDAAGATAAREALARDGGAVALAFADRREALACKARLEEARARSAATEDRR